MKITPDDIDRLVEAMKDGANGLVYFGYHGLDESAVRPALHAALARLNAPQPFECWATYNHDGTLTRLWSGMPNSTIYGRRIRGRFVPDEVQP